MIDNNSITRAADEMLAAGVSEAEIGVRMIGFGVGVLLDMGASVDDLVALIRTAAAEARADGEDGGPR